MSCRTGLTCNTERNLGACRKQLYTQHASEEPATGGSKKGQRRRVIVRRMERWGEGGGEGREGGKGRRETLDLAIDGTALGGRGRRVEEAGVTTVQHYPQRDKEGLNPNKRPVKCVICEACIEGGGKGERGRAAAMVKSAVSTKPSIPERMHAGKRGEGRRVITL